MQPEKVFSCRRRNRANFEILLGYKLKCNYKNLLSEVWQEGDFL